MPKTPKDYSKGLIYKLCCKDTSIKEIYVGSTTNFTQRKRSHKSDCNNTIRKQYNFKVYQFIRENGGWDNWDMVLIEYFPCETELELGRKEEYWKQELQSSLNSYKPPMYETKKEYQEAKKEQIAEYRQATKERKKDTNKEWYEKNKEKLLEKQKQKITCVCGCIVAYIHKARHERTVKHISILEKQNPLGQDIQGSFCETCV